MCISHDILLWVVVLPDYIILYLTAAVEIQINFAEQSNLWGVQIFGLVPPAISSIETYQIHLHRLQQPTILYITGVRELNMETCVSVCEQQFVSSIEIRTNNEDLFMFVSSW